jgi:hypothetical protein
MNSIQQQLRSDKEYVEMVVREGGVAVQIEALQRQFSSDDEFIERLKDVVKTDRKVALSLCAMQEAYTRIRKKRDEHETTTAADGVDRTTGFRQHRGTFGGGPPNT